MKRFLIGLICVVGIVGCEPAPQSTELTKYTTPQNQIITVIADNPGISRGFKIVEVVYNDKKHVFLWHYDYSNQALVKFAELPAGE